MNLRKLISGPLLSIVFLAFFVYVIAWIQWFFDNTPFALNTVATADISAAVQSVALDESENAVVAKPPQNNKINAILQSDNLEINAKSAVSYICDLKGNGNVIFKKDGNASLPIASLTKLMTAVIVLDNYNLSDTWQVSEKADSQYPLKQDIKFGDVLSVENLLNIMLIKSSNKAAYALSELTGVEKFVELMNQKAKDLGLNSTSFVDPTGLGSENISTAFDLIKLAEHILVNYPKMAEISSEKELYLPGFGIVANSDELLLENPSVVFSKTGFTVEANGCLLVAIANPNDGNYIINIVLGADDRFGEMQKLINWIDSGLQ